MQVTLAFGSLAAGGVLVLALLSVAPVLYLRRSEPYERLRGLILAWRRRDPRKR
jgi:hypothetical protein